MSIVLVVGYAQIREQKCLELAGKRQAAEDGYHGGIQVVEMAIHDIANACIRSLIKEEMLDQETAKWKPMIDIYADLPNDPRSTVTLPRAQVACVCRNRGDSVPRF